ncbi:N-acetylmuramoyl-L-alanine amidase [Helicobacter bilis]|uniref:N-acetylmuramoyl-L-alanine amidase n=1 Tax=Helicobacter bilis TaxID=37372 RepID=UPI002557E4EF|nr:peptidoglycan recognition family protein [Helicobacter bilis]
MQTNTLSHQDNITQEKDTLYPHSFLNHDGISSAFVEELATLESIQDNINYIGEILKSYIAGDYGFNVKITIDGKDIKDELYQKMLKDYRYIKDERVKKKIEEYAQANKEDRLKLILACLAAFLAMLFGAAQAHYQYNNPQEKKDYSKEKGIGKLKRFLPRKSTIAFNGYSIIVAIPFSMITSKSVGEITVDVGGGLVATLLGGYAGVKIGDRIGDKRIKYFVPIVGSGMGAGLWAIRDNIQDFITWFNDKQIIEIDIESILENLIDSLDTKNPMPQDPFDIAFDLIYEILSTQAPKLRELISQEFYNLINETPQEIITGNLSNEEFQSLIMLLCDERCNVNDIHNFLECSHYLDRADSKKQDSQDTPLHTAPNTIPIRLQAQCINHNNEPLANKEIYAFSMDIGHFVERVISDDRGLIECNNILVYNNGSLSQVYFVLRQLGLDEEQKITHIQISPRLDISPAYKKQGSLEGIKTLHFAKDIPKHIAQHDKINAQVRVSAIHKIDTIQAHNTTQWAIPLSLKAEYIIKDKAKDIKETQSLIAQYRHNTKWSYIVFEKHQNIHKELQKQGIMLSPTQLNTQGESLSIPIKKDWEGKNIAIFAYLKTPSKSVRYDIKHYRALPLSLQYTGESLDLLSYGQILKSYKLSQTKNEYMRGHGHIELEQGVDTNAKSLDIGTYMITQTDIQSALILTSNKHRIDTPHLVKEFSPLAFECMNDKKRFYISYNANHNNLNLIEYEALQRPINLKSPQIKEHIKIFVESREFFEDLHTIHATMQHKGIDNLVLEVVYVEVEKPYYIDSEGHLQGLDIVKYPITRLELSLANGFMPKAIVLHMTDSNTAKSSLESWNNPNNARVGTHFLIDTDGTIYQCASLHKYTQHVGNIRSKAKETGTWNEKEKKYIVGLGWNPKKLSNYEKTKSYPNRYPTSSDSIGIEVVGKYDDKTKRYPDATTNQLESLEQLVVILLELFNISKTDLYAHAKIAYKDTNMTESVYLLEYLENKL